MAMPEKLEEVLKAKLDIVVEKFKEAGKKLEHRQMELIKEVQPSFEGSVREFFDKHTVASDSTYYTDRHYDTELNKWVKFDLVDGNIGKVYDDLGKTVLGRSKRTKEHIIFEYYSKIMTALVSILFPPNDIEKKHDDKLEIVEYTQEYVRADDNLGENIIEVEEIPQDTPPSGPKF